MGTTAASIKALLREGSNPHAVKGLWESVLRRRRDPQPPERADELGEVELLDHEGREVRLGDYWRDRPAALVFLRHWG